MRDVAEAIVMAVITFTWITLSEARSGFVGGEYATAVGSGNQGREREQPLNLHHDAKLQLQLLLHNQAGEPWGQVYPPAAGLPGYTVLGKVDSGPQMQGGSYVLDMQHTFPPADPARFGDRQHKCYDIAAKSEQPLTEIHKRRHAPPQALAGEVPRTFFRWEGNITRAEFDAVPAEVPRGPKCVHCSHAIRYQIIDGHLYRAGSAPNWLVAAGEDVILVALHLWALPDMDVIVHYDDSCPPGGLPVLSWNVCRDKPKAGFTFPSYTSWMFALGPQQLQVYHQCLATRYPLTNRQPKALWRGSTTDPLYPSFNINIVDKVARMNIHKRFAGNQDLDFQLAKVIFADKCVEDYLKPLAQPIELEDFNNAAIVMDVDGNGWSDRMSRISHFPTPILKQATNHTAFFEHLLAPGWMTEWYANDLSDLKGRGEALLAEWKTNPARLTRLAEQRQGMAHLMLNNVAVAEAAAFSLLQYSKKITWQVTRDPSYKHVSFSSACTHGNLPKALCDEIRSRPSRE